MHCSVVRRLALQFSLIAVSIVAYLGLPSAAFGQTGTSLYWDTNTTGTWSTAANWWTTPTGSVSSTAPVNPTNDAIFNGTTVNSAATTVQLSAAASALGLYFNNTSTTLLESSTTTSEVLSVGTDGINVAATAGAVTLGNATDPMTISIGGTQTWTNNSASALTVVGGISDSATSTLRVAGSGATILSGGISDGTGPLSLVANGTGAVTLSGTNTFSGGVTLSSGTLNINSSTALGATAGVFTISGGVLNNSTAAALTLSNNNAQNWNGNFTFTGTQSLSLGAGAVSLGASNVQITLGGSTLTSAGIISGVGDSLSTIGVTSVGTLSLSGANTFNGGLNVGALSQVNLTIATAAGSGPVVVANGGTLTVDNVATSLSVANPITITGVGASSVGAIVSTNTTGVTATGNINTLTGGITLAGNATIAATLDPLAISTGGINIGSNTLTLASSAAAQSITISSAISDSGAGGGLRIANTSNAGTVILSSPSNSYTGATLISGGVLDDSQTASTLSLALPATTAVTQTGTGQLEFQLVPGASLTSMVSYTIPNALTLTGSHGVANFSPVVGIQGGAVWLNTNFAAYTFSGPITIAGGTSTEFAMYSAGNTLTFTGGIGDNGTGTGNLVLAGGGAAASHAHVFIFANANNTYGGSTLLLGQAATDTIQLGAANALPTTTTLTLEGDFFGGAGLKGWLDLNSNSQQLAGLLAATTSLTTAGTPGDNRVVNTGSGTPTLTLAPSGTNVFSGILGGGASNNSFNLTMAGTGTLALTGVNTYTGATTINANGTIRVGNSGATGSLGATPSIANAGTLSFDLTTGLTVTANLSGAGAVQQIGSGTTILNGTNTATGLTTVSSGVLEFNAFTTTLPAGSITVTLGGAVAAGPLYISGTGSTTPLNSNFLPLINLASTGTIALTANSSENLNFTSFTSGGPSLGAIGAVSYSGTLTPNGSTYRLGGGGGTLTFATALPDVAAGPTALVIAPSGTVALTDTVNSFSGGTTVNGGVLSINSDSTGAGPAELGQAPATPTTSLVLNGGTLQATGTFALNPNRGIALGATTGNGGGSLDVTFGNTLTYTGTIVNNNTTSGATDSLTVTDSGTVVLTGTNTYNGGTTIQGGGTLRVNPTAATPTALGSGAITINTGRLSLATSTAQTNALTVTAPSIVDVTGVSSAALTGSVSLTGSTLQVTGGSTAADTPYSLSLGTVSGNTVAVSGGATFDVLNNGAGASSLALGPLVGSGIAQTITFAGGGTTTLTGAATALPVGSRIILGSGANSSVTGITPVNQWNFEAGSGTTAFDTGTAHLNGVLGGSTLPISTGLAASGNAALNFTGANSYVEIPYSSADALSSYTVSAWINLPTIPTTGVNYNFFSTRGNAAGADPNLLADFKISGSATPGVVSIHGDIGNGGGWLTTSADFNGVSMTPGKWYLVTYSVGVNGGEIYLNGGTADGGLQTPIAYSGTPLLANSSSVITLGQVSPGGGENFVGDLDDVRVYGSALTAAQVAQSYMTSGAPTVNTTTAAGLGTTSQVTVSPGAGLSLGGAQTVSSLAGTGSVKINGNTLTIGSTDNLNNVFAGVISDGSAASSVVKAGTGGLALLSSNAYSGGTTVSAGVLTIGGASNPIGSGSLVLNGGNLALVGQQTGAAINQGLQLQLYAESANPLAANLTTNLSTLTSHFASLIPSLTTQTTTGGLASLNWPTSATGSIFTAQGFSTTVNYEAQLTGQIYIAQAGTYTFQSSSDDTNALYIDGNSVPNVISAVSTVSGTPLSLSAGFHTLDVGYQQITGAASLLLSYSGPDTGNTMTLIPNNVLISGAGTTNSTQTYANPLTVNMTSTISVSGSLAATMGDLTIGASTLHVTSSDTTGSPYSLKLVGSSGVTTLTGNPTFNINNSSGGGTGTLTLGSLNDGGSTVRTVTINGQGNVNLASAATSLLPNTQINIVGQLVSAGPTAGLVSNYQFEEGSGTTANDLGSNHLAGTLIGPGVAYTTAAKTGLSALNFTATASYVQIPHSTLDNLSTYTISAWVNSSSFANGNATIFATRNSGDNTFDIQITAAGLHADVGTGGGWLDTAVNLTHAIATNTWYLVTYSVSPSGANVYLNDGTTASGGSTAAFIAGTTPGYAAGTPMLEAGSAFATIGNQGAINAANQFLGSIDDVRIYNTALTAAQVQQLYTTVPAGVTLNSSNATAIGSGSQLSVGLGSIFNVGASQQVATLAGNGGVTLNANTLSVGTGSSDATNSTFSGTLSGAGGGLTLNKAPGGGLFLLNAVATYSGPTTINGGTLSVGVTPATISLANNNFAAPTGISGGYGYGPNGASGTPKLTAAQLTSAVWTFTNNAGLTDVGFGFTPASNAANTGDTQYAFVQASSATLQSSLSQSAFFQPGTYQVSFYSSGRSGGSNPLSVFLNPGSNNLVTAGGVDLTNVTPVVGAWNLYTASTTITTAGNYTLDFLGSLTPTDETSFIDDVTIINSTPGATGVLSATSPMLLTSSNSSLVLNSNSQSIGSLTGVSGSSVSLGSATLTIGGDNSSPAPYAGIVSGTGNLIKVGAGALTLGGANTYSGGTTVTSGTLRVSNGTNGSATGTGNVLISSGATLGVAVASGSGTIAPTGSNTVTVATGGFLAGANGVTLTLTNGLTLQPGVTTTADLSGTPNGTSGSNPLLAVTGGALIATSGNYAINLIGTPSSGSYDLLNYTGATPSGSGNFVLGTTPSGFGFQLQLNQTTSQLDLIVVGALTWTGASGNSNWTTSASDTNWASGSPAVASQYLDPAPVTFADKNPITNALVTSTAISIQAAGVNPTSVTFTNSGTASGGVNYTISNASGTVGISGSTGITLNGTGSVTLQSPNSFSGPVAIEQGLLVLQDPAALGSSSGVTVSSGGALKLQGIAMSANIPLNLNGAGLAANPLGALNASGNSSYAGSIAIQSNASIYSATAGDTLTLNGPISNSSSTLTIAGAGNTLASSSVSISGGGGLTVATTGTGTLTLAGTNTYTGATAVNSGTLRVTGSLASGSAVSVGGASASGSPTLAGGGSGTIGGSVTVSGTGPGLVAGTIAPSGFTSSPSPTPTTLNIGGSLTLGSGAILDYNLSNVGDDGSSNASNDHVVVAGNVSLSGGTLNISALNGLQQNGVYELISTSGGTLTSTGSWTVTGASGFTPTFTSTNGQFDLVLTVSGGSDTWSGNTPGSDNNYNNPSNWQSGVVPNGAGQVATFGTGTAANINVNTAVTLGQIVFNNSSIGYSLGTLGTPGAITLDNAGGGASITVASGAAAPLIYSTLTFSDSSLQTTFNIAANTSLEVVNTISEATHLGQQLILTGGGALQLDSVNSYTGGTTVTNGTLTVGSAATIGSGPLTFNPGSGNTATVNVQNSIATGPLSQTGSTGTAQLNVASSTALTVNQTASGNFGGTLSLGSNAQLVMQAATSNTLTISGAPTLASGSSISVNSGTLAFAVTTGSASVSSNVSVNVAAAATLQLAGTESALSDTSAISPASNNLATVNNHGSTASGGGVLVTGTNQSVGILTGTGTTNTDGATVYDGDTVVGNGSTASDLTVTQILQNTLTINAGSTVTIRPSGAGTPMVATAASTSVASSATASSAASSDTSGDNAFTTIQDAILTGAISSTTGQRLENRIAVIEQLATTNPGLDVSLLENRVLAAIPASSLTSGGTTSLGSSSLGSESGSGLLALDNSSLGSTGSSLGGATSAFSSGAGFSASPAAVPEPSTLLLAALGGLGLALAARRRKARHGSVTRS